MSQMCVEEAPTTCPHHNSYAQFSSTVPHLNMWHQRSDLLVTYAVHMRDRVPCSTCCVCHLPGVCVSRASSAHGHGT
ncbi:hypothetical protein PanWU01x14_166150 [Parasponia andersonii]|uniref:Uncharacterized protein n=1 Tax=Parasponia andersonii TaxID=3476 RepID=A0A2P5CBG8_PARAD|nr:hypothetical protein PanWU01x14_166150 [Parasponia andersonii]